MKYSATFHKTISRKVRLAALVVFFIVLSCGEDCKYTTLSDNKTPVIPVGCTLSNSITLSTGIDAEGNLIAPGDGITDSFWKVLNNPPLLSCDNPLTTTINGSSYIINLGPSSNNDWVNQPTASTLAPMDLGTTHGFGCNNATNALGIQVPYVFERSFCVLKDTSVDFNFTFKGDDHIYFELINTMTNTVLSTSLRYIYPAAPSVWSTSLPLSAGSYSLRGYLINTSSVILGFSLSGSMTTTNGDLAISNNALGCCENNTISILNVLDSNCNHSYENTDVLGSGWTFQLKDNSNRVIRTGIVNADGNIFFSGLADGTYTISTTAQDGWSLNTPVGGTATITISGNTVKIVEFYNCH